MYEFKKSGFMPSIEKILEERLHQIIIILVRIVIF
ncbi:hypothetical protein ABH968_001750 [Lysinibacillus sp. RC79]